MKKSVGLFVLCCVFSVFCGAAFADKYPSKPISLVVPYGPGSGDAEARMFAKVLEKYLGQPIVPSNFAGGGGAVGLNRVRQSRPDGYTIGFMSASIGYGMAQGNIKAAPDEIQVLGCFNGDWMGIFVPASSPFKTFAELVAYAKEKPGELLIGGTNVASAHHSFLMTLCNDAGIEVQYVPYTGANDTTLALLSGNVGAAVLYPNSVRQYMETDGVRLLTYSTRSRVEEFKDIPTAYEMGYKNVDDLMQFRGYFTSCGVSEEILAVIDSAMQKAVSDPVYQEYLKKNHLTPLYKDHAEFGDFYKKFVETAKASYQLMKK
ncbi:MAG: tripartite tricarboxylate transporter substrate binding protein [Pyramidobacter sp.]|nr:tripartite tricarboxylate transporter substrate binding protein [Pyramidobacter sp.]